MQAKSSSTDTTLYQKITLYPPTNNDFFSWGKGRFLKFWYRVVTVEEFFAYFLEYT